MLQKVKDIEKLKIETLNGKLGYVHDFYFDDREWITRYMVVDTGDWLTGRKVLVSPHAIKKPDFGNKLMPVNLTQIQIEESPNIDVDKPVSRQQESHLSNYYGWPAYWAADPIAHAVFTQKAVEDSEKENLDSNSSHLRSIREVRNYFVKAIDGEVGSIDSFLIDDNDWKIKFIVMDTRKWFSWLPGGSYHLISPEWIKDIDWSESKILIEYDKKTLENSPLYDSAKEIDDDFENRLYDCYNSFIDKKSEAFIT
jgi:hypothetical protein